VSIVGGSPSDYALDRDNSKVPVTVGTRYKISFDAAYIGGGSNLLFGVAEHNRNQTSLKGTSYNVVVTNMNYQTYSCFWTPTTNETAYVNLAFRLRPQGGFKTSSMRFDNVRLDRAVATVSFTNLLQICDGTPKSVAVATDPPGLTVDVTYDGASTAPSRLGSYTVVGTVRETNYEPTSATNTLMIVTPFAPITGGGFENLTLGTVVGGGSGYTDTTNFSPWRIYNVAAGSGTFFTGTVVSAASEGTRALRLDLVSPDLANASCALDRFVQGTFLPVNPAARYLVTFDAARVSGSPRFRVVVPEYNDTPAYLGKQATYFFDLPGTNYQTLSFVWSPQSASVTQIALGFTPWCVATNTSASYLVDNVCLTPLGEVALRGLTQDYDGTAKSVSAVTDPPGLPVALTYNGSASAPSNGGVYTVVGAVTNALYACSVTNLFLIKDAGVAQLKTNGSFEAQSGGTTVSIGAAGTVDTTTFSGWRLFSVGSPAVSNFTATIVPDASEGDVGMRLGFIDAGGVSADHGLDCEDVAKMPVAYGTRYKVSFDAAWDSDSRKVDAGVAEYKSTGAYAGITKTYTIYANSTNYQNFAFVWTPVSNVTAWANLAFRQRSSGAYTASVMRFDNVRFDPLVATVSLTNLVHESNDASWAATAATTPGGLTVTLTYNGSATVPTEPGRYTVVGTVSDAYFSGCVTNTLVIHGPKGTVLSIQ